MTVVDATIAALLAFGCGVPLAYAAQRAMRPGVVRVRRVPTWTERERREAAWRAALGGAGFIAGLAFIGTKIAGLW